MFNIWMNFSRNAYKKYVGKPLFGQIAELETSPNPVAVNKALKIDKYF